MLDYDVFEKFPDGSLIWRGHVLGKYSTERAIQKFQKTSANEFYALRLMPTNSSAVGAELPSPRPARSLRRGKKRVA